MSITKTIELTARSTTLWRILVIRLGRHRAEHHGMEDLGPQYGNTADNRYYCYNTHFLGGHSFLGGRA